ncbi:MAG: RNA polymerase sigma-70 factor [Anaerolineae bacterium]|nr:RNA polymerase sigma-70 factor [Anaerolineae bacterium]
MNDVDTERFEAYRPLMFSIAYRMLGTITDAEDMVQKAYLRYQGAKPEEIVSHKAFLSTVVTRLCLNHLDLAQTQRESYVGPWLPEPAMTASDERFAPAQRTELHESLSLAFLTLLEQLTPLERAVFLLREVFDYEYAEIATIVSKEEAACRQMLSRARKHLAENRPRFKPTPEMHRQMLDQFIHTAQNGELEGLLQLLADDVVLWADGGGKVLGAIVRPLRGRKAVSQFIMASQRFATQPFYPEIVEINNEPAMILRSDTEVRLVLSISLDAGRICALHIIGNPDKLKWLNQDINKNRDGAE